MYTHIKIKVFLLAPCILMLLPGCTDSRYQVRPADGVNLAQSLAEKSGWKSSLIRTDIFDLLAYESPRNQGIDRPDLLAIYIEGDGHAWVDSQTPSGNPTPVNPIALRMALRDASYKTAYLARPCQYVDSDDARNCMHRYWTSHRFSEEVIQSSGQAIDRLKLQSGASKLILLGYSGGAAVALLLAARRDDVIKVATIAGNLDIEAWVSHHRLTPLYGSLSPTKFVKELASVDQIHYVGDGDANTLSALTESFIAQFPEGRRPRMRVIEGFTHTCCWAQEWHQLWPDGER